jgi:monomeric isocitrate dehydrogenase
VIGVDIRNAAVWSIRDDPYSDVILETSAQRLDGPQDGYYGVVCRQVDNDNYYGLEIGSDGSYGILKMLDGKMDFLAEGSAPDGVIQADQPNLLRGECVGETLTLFANGQKLAEAQDADLDRGAAGMLAGTHGNPGFEALFTAFKVYQP